MAVLDSLAEFGEVNPKWKGPPMKPTPDSQIINLLAAALEPAVVAAVERTVRETLLKTNPIEQAAEKIQKTQKKSVAAPEQLDRLLSVKEVAAYLSIGRSTVYTMIQRGDLPSVKFGRNRRFWLRDVEGMVMGGD